MPVMIRPRKLGPSTLASRQRGGCQLPIVFSFVIDIDLLGPLGLARDTDCIAHTAHRARVIARLRAAAAFPGMHIAARHRRRSP
jgi:hypothetical protein